jgi:hypothetical protein
MFFAFSNITSVELFADESVRDVPSDNWLGGGGGGELKNLARLFLERIKRSKKFFQALFCENRGLKILLQTLFDLNFFRIFKNYSPKAK